MSVLRAMLGRFARFLVRIARTLDPALATAPYWLMPERMAALRQRYPGAPDHWLELIARRGAMGEAPDPHVSPAEPAAHRAEERPSFDSRTPEPRRSDTLRRFLRLRDRPAVGFPRPAPRSKFPPSDLRIAARTEPGPPVTPSPEARATRPGLTFSTRSVRNPIANLLRTDRPSRRSAMLRFPASPLCEIGEAPEPEEFVRREHRTFFPDPIGHESHRPDMASPADVQHDPAPVDTRWPTRPERASTDTNWLSGQPGAARPSPSFRSRDPRWPELPPVAIDDRPSLARSLDEAIFLAEQIGGSWSE